MSPRVADDCSVGRACVVFASARTIALRQHEPRLCSAWIPRSRTQRLTIMEVPLAARELLPATGAPRDRTTLRSRLLKQHSASERVTGDWFRRPRVFLDDYREPLSQLNSLQPGRSESFHDRPAAAGRDPR